MDVAFDTARDDLAIAVKALLAPGAAIIEGHQGPVNDRLPHQLQLVDLLQRDEAVMGKRPPVRAILERILTTADSFINITEREVKSVPLLRGRSVFNLFFENSTRTRTTFEIAAKRLSADVVSIRAA